MEKATKLAAVPILFPLLDGLECRIATLCLALRVIFRMPRFLTIGCCLWLWSDGLSAAGQDFHFSIVHEVSIFEALTWKSARGLAHSKTWRSLGRSRRARGVLECCNPLQLW